MKMSFSSRQLTVSSAQYRFVAIIPVGPRFNHPHTYKPFSRGVESPEASARTRPPMFGTTPAKEAMRWKGSIRLCIEVHSEPQLEMVSWRWLQRYKYLYSVGTQADLYMYILYVLKNLDFKTTNGRSGLKPYIYIIIFYLPF